MGMKALQPASALGPDDESLYDSKPPLVLPPVQSLDFALAPKLYPSFDFSMFIFNKAPAQYYKPCDAPTTVPLPNHCYRSHGRNPIQHNIMDHKLYIHPRYR